MAIVVRPDLALFSHQRVKVLLPQSRFPEAIVSGRIGFKAFNAIIEPPIPNCDIYFVSGHLGALPVHSSGIPAEKGYVGYFGKSLAFWRLKISFSSHAFPNDTSVTILKNIAKSMSPTSRLLLRRSSSKPSVCYLTRLFVLQMNISFKVHIRCPTTSLYTSKRHFHSSPILVLAVFVNITLTLLRCS